MATKQGVRSRQNNGALLYTWSDVDSGDVGTAALVETESELDVQVVGTLSGSTVALQGSMDGTNWATLTMSPTPLVAATISRSAQKALYIRPSVTGGTGADLVVMVLATPNK